MTEKPTYEELESRIKELELSALDSKRDVHDFKESEYWFSKIFENVSTGIAVTDWQEQFQLCNPAYCDLLGYTMDEFEKASFPTLVHPDDQEENLAQIERLKAGELPYFIIENRYIHKSNYPIWVRKYVSILPDRFGRPSYLIALVSDISKDKGFQDKLLSIMSEAERLADFGAWEWDIVRNEWTMSDNWLKIHGCEGRILKTDELLSIAHPEDKNRIQKAFDRTINHGVPYELEHRIVRQDTGDLRYVRAYGTVKHDSFGKPLKLYGAAQDITEKKIKELELEQSEKKYRNLINTAQEGIWVIDKDDKTTFVNPSMSKILGYTADEMIGKHLFDFMDDQGVELARIKLDRRRQKIGEQHDFEFIHKHGQRVYTTIETAAIEDENGNYDGAIAGIIDISKRKKVENSLHESEARFQSSFESSAVGMVIVDDHGNFLSINRSACDQLGYSEEEMMKMSFLDITYKEDQERSSDRFKQCLEDKRAYVVERRYKAKNGNLVWGQTTVSPVFDAKDEFLYVVAHLQNITDQKETHALLEKRNTDLKLAQRIASIGTWTLDPEIGVPEWSDEIYRIYERDPRLDPHSLADYKTIYKGKWWERFNTAIQGAVKDGTPYDIELKFELPSGKVKWVHAICEPEPAPGPKGHKVRGTIQDITGKKQSEQKRLKLEGQLRQSQKMEAIGTMAGGIAHDFNNLLAIISGNLELLHVKQQAGNPIDENLEHIKEASGRAKNLVAQILAFSRQEQKELAPVNLTTFVSESLKFLRPMIPTTVEVVTEAPGDPVQINADTTQLQQVLINLCSNALHAMNDKGLLRISLREGSLEAREVAHLHGISQATRYAKLSVSDTGKGMNKKTLDRIFDPFFTTKEVGRGTGMGLSVVHGIIEQHGGFIQVDSTPGQGSSFTLYFPSTDDVEATEERVAKTTLPTGTESILFVDDEQSVAAASRSMLEHLGYNVTMMTNSVEALDLFRAHPDDYDLVITDQTMPKMSGAELAKELLKIRPDLPIVLCSGYSAQITAEDTLEIGIHAFCMKPIEMKQLATVARDALDTSKKPSGTG